MTRTNHGIGVKVLPDFGGARGRRGIILPVSVSDSVAE